MGLLSKYGVSASSPNLGTPRWQWMNAQARLATPVGLADLGARGFQQDIAREYQLLSLTGGAPARWGQVPATDVLFWRTVCGGNGFAGYGMQAQTTGTAGGGTLDNSSIANRLIRHYFGTTTVNPGGYGQVSYHPSGPGPSIGGIRLLTEFVCQNGLAPTWRWFAGLVATAMVGDLDPALQVNIFGIGRNNNQANVHTIRNNNVGAALIQDLGSSFPAAGQVIVPSPYVIPLLYQLEIYVAPGAASWAFNLHNRENGREVSGTYSTELPDPTLRLMWQFYWNNNTSTNANINNIHIGYLMEGQIAR